MAIFCKKCGKHLEEDCKFCPECGTPQFGHIPPETEFRTWRRKRILMMVKIGIGLMILGLVIKTLQVAILGSIIFLIAAFQLNKMGKDQ